MGNPSRSDGNAAGRYSLEGESTEDALDLRKRVAGAEDVHLGQAPRLHYCELHSPIDCPGSRSCSATCTHRQKHSQTPEN